MTCISPIRTLLAEVLDSDCLYALPETEIPTASTVKSRKRPAASKPGLVSFTRLWEYEDDGITALPDQGPPLKRTRIAPKKRSQSVKALSAALKQVVDHSEIEDGSQTIPSTSQLSTPPVSMKLAQSRVGSLPSKTKLNAKPLFENSIITKSTMTVHRETKNGLDPEQVKSFQGFTTTEDKIRSAAMCLSQTTLEKLASFRYRPSQEVPISATQLESVKTLHNIVLPALTMDQINTEFPLSNLDRASSDSFFEQGTWHVENSNRTVNHTLETAPKVDFMLTDRTVISVNSAISESVIVKKFTAQEVSTPVQEVDTPLIAVHPGLGHIDSGVGTTGSNTTLSEQGDHCGTPTASEKNLLLRPADRLQRELDNETPSPYRTSKIGKPENLCEIETNKHFPVRDDGTNLPNYSLRQPGQHIESTTDMRINPSMQRNGIFHGSNYQPSHLITTTDVKVCHQTEMELSKPEEHGLISHPANTTFDSDFDDEIDDEDLRDLVLEIVLQQTPPKARQVTNKCYVKSNEGAHNGYVDDEPLMNETVNTLDQNNTTVTPFDQEGASQSVSFDEFDMEQDDVNQMLILSELCSDIINTIPHRVDVQEELSEGESRFVQQVGFSCLRPLRTAPTGYMLRDYSATGIESEQIDLTGDEEGEDWVFMHTNDITQDEAQVGSDRFTVPQAIAPQPASVEKFLQQTLRCTGSRTSRVKTATKATTTQLSPASVLAVLDDSHEYKPLPPFVRPPYTPSVMDRCPIVGISAQKLLRTCFRIGEMFQVGAKCNALGIDAVIELFARVCFSSREPGTTKQHFQFLDLWSDRAPYPNGILASFKTTGLAESESKVFLTSGEKKIARVLGKLKKDGQKGGPWKLEIINIRETDWEEIRWTCRIVSGNNLVKKERELCAQSP